MKISGIYKIESLIKPERIYIGSASNMINRWRCHLSSLVRNKHHSRKLQNHYNKYGKEDLKFILIEICNEDELIKKEQYFIDSYKPYFNICLLAGRTSGVKRTEQTRIKISKSKKGKPSPRKGVILSKETIQKMRLANLGKKMSEETKLKIKNTLNGRIFTDEHRHKISKALKGKVKTESHIENNRLSQIGKHNTSLSIEARKKLSLSKMGHSVSLETRAKLRAANLGKASRLKGRKFERVPWNKGLSKGQQLLYKNKNKCVLVA